jgi:DNA modification methylase
MKTAKILVGDSTQLLANLPSEYAQCVITSPPYYGLRDYGEEGQLGLEKTPEEYIEKLADIFDQVYRVLKTDGTLWLNLGDSFGVINKRPKNLLGLPWRIALELQARGWYLRTEIIWHKPNPMPESVTDRPTRSHEYIFLLTKSPSYYYDFEAIKEDAVTPPVSRDKHAEGYQADYSKGDRFSAGARVYGADGKRNKRSVWTIPLQPYPEAHFATYPVDLVEPCVLAGSQVGDIVLDPFSGSGTTGVVAVLLQRNFLGLELNPEYAKLSEARIAGQVGLFGEVTIEGLESATN